MSTNADGPRIHDAAADAATDDAPNDEPAVPPVLSGKSMLRKGFLRWLLTGSIRLLYRFWTRIAVRLFPEDSRRAAFATRIGIPLPDQLNMSWITPHLAVGGRILPADIPRLARTGITRVVDTRSEHKDDTEALGREGIQLLYLPTPDTTPLTIAQLQEGARWINQQVAAGERVLVHCEHGVGRSVLLTAAALVAGGMSAHNAIDLVQRKRWQAAPNHRQMRRLQEFERAVHLAQLPTRA
jgi:protein-tyrosine phosphatase